MRGNYLPIKVAAPRCCRAAHATSKYAALHRAPRAPWIGCCPSTGFSLHFRRSNSTETSVRQAQTRAHIRGESAPTVYVGMSGGVDSTVSALLLKEQGLNVVGVHMKNWDKHDEEGAEVCPADEDDETAQRAAQELDVPLKRVNFVKEYWTNVFEPWIDSYQRGETPNPDVYCNRYIKFGAFLANCLNEGAEYVATGHYAKVLPEISPHSNRSSPQERRLYRGADHWKDQSYFMCCVKKEALQNVILPLGGLYKSAVRRIASNRGLSNADRKDSYGICFIGKRKLAEFLPNYVHLTPGKFIDIDSGKPMGDHEGVELYTEGQSARISGASCKYFVSFKDLNEGNIYVAAGATHPAQLSTSLRAPVSGFNWLERTGLDLHRGKDCKVRLRHRQDELIPSNVQLLDDYIHVHFHESQRNVSPGQIVALYDTNGELCYGGGPIESRMTQWEADHQRKPP
eukprot:gb/GECG01003249.1/.p1 GENE.gb/GECG01003249.1/~~gb/GECG01003249.1/.p1  ORF type:complete len:456 (+),score=38.42 gb/GECG01003249.1/:1-1368(+)